MIKENNPLLKLNIEKKKSFTVEFYNSLSEDFYCLFDSLLEKPIESFWVECLHLFFGYTQIMAFIFDSTVRIIINQIYLNYFSLIQFGIKNLL